MSRQLAILHNERVQLEALITKRLAMFAANHAAEQLGRPPKYSEQDFEKLEADIRGCWLDPDIFN